MKGLVGGPLLVGGLGPCPPLKSGPDALVSSDVVPSIVRISPISLVSAELESSMGYRVFVWRCLNDPKFIRLDTIPPCDRHTEKIDG